MKISSLASSKAFARSSMYVFPLTNLQLEKCINEPIENAQRNMHLYTQGVWSEAWSALLPRGRYHLAGMFSSSLAKEPKRWSLRKAFPWLRTKSSMDCPHQRACRKLLHLITSVLRGKQRERTKDRNREREKEKIISTPLSLFIWTWNGMRKCPAPRLAFWMMWQASLVISALDQVGDTHLERLSILTPWRVSVSLESILTVNSLSNRSTKEMAPVSGFMYSRKESLTTSHLIIVSGDMEEGRQQPQW